MEAFFFRPPIVFLITIVTLLAAGWLGSWLRQKVSLDEKQREDFLTGSRLDPYTARSAHRLQLLDGIEPL